MGHDNRALITGISGQDGAYLASFLCSKGYRVFGTSRHADPDLKNLIHLKIRDKVQIHTLDLTRAQDTESVLRDIKPDEIYHLAGQSSVGKSFELPGQTFTSNAITTLNILEGARKLSPDTRVFLAGSAECFGECPVPAREDSPFNPLSPYAAAKASSFWLASTYRKAYNLYFCTGILFNHESPLRPPGFVTSKIVSTAAKIAAGYPETLKLGNIDIIRDWGWAPEYVQAMWLMLNQEEPMDLILATGESHSLRDFTKAVFHNLGLDWKDHVKTSPGLLRPADILVSRADPSRAKKILGWEAEYKMNDVARLLVSGLFDNVG